MSNRVVAFDLETYCISPALVAPPIVVGSWAERQTLPAWIAPEGTQVLEKGLLPGLGIGTWLRTQLEAGVHIVGANIAYDLFEAVQEWPELTQLVFEAYEEGRVHDVQLREQLIDIARGTLNVEVYQDETGEERTRTVRYSLADLAKRHLNMNLDKSQDSWRLRYNELHGVPLEQWPEDAKHYAIDDAIATLEVFEAQENDLVWREYLARLEPDQVRAAFGLQATGARGMCLDLDAVDALESKLRAAREAAYPPLLEAGIYRANGSKDMARLKELITQAYEAQGEPVPMTEGTDKTPPSVKTGMATLRESNSPVLVQAASFAKNEKLLTGFMPALRVGSNFPLTCSYKPLLETGRTSSFGIKYEKQKGPQFQNFPRKAGIRECFVPRDGYYFCSVDYSQLELCTLAQVVYTQGCGSNLRDAINAGKDLHVIFACAMMGWNYEEVVGLKKQQPYKDARQGAKAANFGFPGGLGAARFVTYARDNYGVELSVYEASKYQQLWRDMWPDARQYQINTSNAMVYVSEDEKRVGVESDQTGFRRGDCKYTEACNTLFQHLAAAGAKRAVWRLITQAQEMDCWPVAFIHDEIVAEVPVKYAHEVAHEISRIMVSEMSGLVPDVQITAEPALMARWLKDAEPVYENGRLVPWQPKGA